MIKDYKQYLLLKVLEYQNNTITRGFKAINTVKLVKRKKFFITFQNFYYTVLQVYNNNYLDFVPKSLLPEPDPELLKEKKPKLISITPLLKVLLLNILSLPLDFYLGFFPSNRSIPNSFIPTSKLYKLNTNLPKTVVRFF